MSLSSEHIERIKHCIDESGVTIQTLKDDLLDHLSCAVEIEIKAGNDFGAALREALTELAPKGLREIEEQTIFLLNPLKIRYMKKIMYVIGLMSATAISLGWLFIVLQWPGGRELFNYGFLAFLLLFVPMLAFDRYKVNLRKALSEKVRIILGFVSAMVIGIAVAFKFLHLPGADILLIAGMLIFTFGFLPFLFFTMYRKAISQPDTGGK